MENRFKVIEDNVAVNKKTSLDNKSSIKKNSTETSGNGQNLKRNNLLLTRLKNIPFKKSGHAFSVWVADKLNSLFSQIELDRQKNNR